MKIKLLGKNLDDIRPLLKKYGFEESDNEIEMIVTHGGDGALLGAEREFPGIPKFPLRDAATAPTCSCHEAEKRLRNFIAGNHGGMSRLPKVEAAAPGGSTCGINDVFLYSSSRTSALRYRVMIDGELYAAEVVGDAVGVSTVHGSGAYYRSITHGVFRVGMGLSFSNSTEAVDHMVLDEKSSVEITILRGTGLLIADNSPETITVNEGESVIFRQSDSAFAGVWDLAAFMCPECRLLRHPHPHPLKWVK